MPDYPPWQQMSDSCCRESCRQRIRMSAMFSGWCHC